MKYPPGVVTNVDKIEFCYAAQEKLRLEHNAKGKDYRDGVITKEEWEQYKSTDFDDKKSTITSEILAMKELMKNSQRFTVDLEDLK